MCPKKGEEQAFSLSYLGFCLLQHLGRAIRSRILGMKGMRCDGTKAVHLRFCIDNVFTFAH